MSNTTNVGVFAIDRNTPMSFLTVGQFEDILDKRIGLLTPPQPQPFKDEPEFVNDEQARYILSGNPDKPISKPFFNELRAKGLINDYPIGKHIPGARKQRVVFKRSELVSYLNSNKKPSSK